MIKAYEVNKEKVGTKPIGQIKGMGNGRKYKNTVISYLAGEIPILIETDLTQEQWDRMSTGKLTDAEIFSLKLKQIM